MRGRHWLTSCCGPQVRDGAMSCLVEIYRHVGERVRMDLSKKGLPQSRYVTRDPPRCHFLSSWLCFLLCSVHHFSLKHTKGDSECRSGATSGGESFSPRPPGRKEATGDITPPPGGRTSTLQLYTDEPPYAQCSVYETVLQ